MDKILGKKFKEVNELLSNSEALKKIVSEDPKDKKKPMEFERFTPIGIVGSILITAAGITAFLNPSSKPTEDLLEKTPEVKVSDESVVFDTIPITPRDVRVRIPNKATETYNYANIRPTKNKWMGQAGVRKSTSSGRFVKFETPYHGIRAALYNLYGYGSKKVSGVQGRQLYTIEDIIGVYAPSSENDTLNYVNYMYNQLGLTRGQRFDVSTQPELLVKLTRAILKMESGTTVSEEYLYKVQQKLVSVDTSKPESTIKIYNSSVVSPRRGFNKQLD